MEVGVGEEVYLRKYWGSEKMVEGTIGKIVEEIKADLHDRKENWKDTWEAAKKRLSLKEVGKPLIFSEDTIIGRHSKRARERTARTLRRK